MTELYRSSSSPSAAFGEDEVFNKLRAWMTARGYSMSDIALQIDQLRVVSSVSMPPSPTELADESDEDSVASPTDAAEELPESKSKLVFVDADVESFKLIRGGVKFVKGFPKNSTGKIERTKLPEFYLNHF